MALKVVKALRTLNRKKKKEIAGELEKEEDKAIWFPAKNLFTAGYVICEDTNIVCGIANFQHAIDLMSVKLGNGKWRMANGRKVNA